MGGIYIVNHPEALPQQCANCGAARSDRKYVDFGLSLDFYGVVYLCSICVEEIASAFGLVVEVEQQEEYEGLQERYAELDEANSSLVAENERLHGILGSKYFDHNVSTQSLSSSDSRTGDESEADTGTERTRRSGNTRSSESRSVRGSKDVPSLEDFLSTGNR